MSAGDIVGSSYNNKLGGRSNALLRTSNTYHGAGHRKDDTNSLIVQQRQTSNTRTKTGSRNSSPVQETSVADNHTVRNTMVFDAPKPNSPWSYFVEYQQDNRLERMASIPNSPPEIKEVQFPFTTVPRARQIRSDDLRLLNREHADHLEEMDNLHGFITDKCYLHESAKVTTKELYDAYLDYCEVEKMTPVKQRTFGMMLRERGFKSWRNTKSRGWIGIRLRGEVEPVLNHPA